jgi:formate dehydrogenase subunit delta
MALEHLIAMANDISHYFAADPQHEVAVAGIANHIQRYWDPRMRRQILAHLKTGGEGLEPLAREALARVTAPAAEQAGRRAETSSA